jgi:hypothetical protein
MRYDTRDGWTLDALLDGELQAGVLVADTDEGFVEVVVTHPDAGHQRKSKGLLVDRREGEVEVRNARRSAASIPLE